MIQVDLFSESDQLIFKKFNNFLFSKTLKASKLRSKRKLEDVEKIIEEDEFMSYLICDMCAKNECSPKYCKFCTQCDTNLRSELKLIILIFDTRDENISYLNILHLIF